MRRLALLIVLALALAAPALASANIPAGFVGVTADGPMFPAAVSKQALNRQMDKMVASGVQTVRVVFDWATTQPYRRWREVPADQRLQFAKVHGIPTRFGPLDQFVGAAAAHGLSVLPVVIYAPRWDAAPHSVKTFAAPAKNRFYAQFLTDLIDRYGPSGIFWYFQPHAVPIRSWQVWNEPNIRTFWPKRPITRTYMALVKSAHDAIKAADPAAKVVLAGLPNYSWLQLKSFYAVKGARRLFDVVAVHPYTRKPDGVLQILQRVRNVMDHAGDQRKPLLADEVSWPSSLGKVPSGGLGNIPTTEAGQARNISQLLPMLAGARHRLRLIGFDYYTWAGVEKRSGRAFDYAGLLRYSHKSFVAKPALSAFRRAALGLEGCRQKGAMATVCLRSA